MAAVPLIAHVGHWTHLLLYLTPVIAVLLAIAINAIRERRR